MCPDIASQLAPGGSGRTVTQAVVDAVVVLLESDAFAAPLPSGPAAAAVSLGEPVAAAGSETAAMRFLAAHLASNRAVVPSAVLLRVLGHLARPSAVAAAAAGDMQADEREAVFCDVIAAAAGGLGPADRQQVRGRAICEVVFCVSASYMYQPTVAATAASHQPHAHLLSRMQALYLARQAGFLQAEARVRHAEGLRGEALACLARDARCGGGRAVVGVFRETVVAVLACLAKVCAAAGWPLLLLCICATLHDIACALTCPPLCPGRHPAAAFKYVRDVLSDPVTPLTAQQRDAFTAAVLAQAPQLLSLDAPAAAQVGRLDGWAGFRLTEAVPCHAFLYTAAASDAHTAPSTPFTLSPSALIAAGAGLLPGAATGAAGSAGAPPSAAVCLPERPGGAAPGGPGGRPGRQRLAQGDSGCCCTLPAGGTALNCWLKRRQPLQCVKLQLLCAPSLPVCRPAAALQRLPRCWATCGWPRSTSACSACTSRAQVCGYGSWLVQSAVPTFFLPCALQTS